MKTFIFMLYVMNPTGEYSGFAIDTGVSEADCMALHEQWAPTLDEHSTVFCFEEQTQ